MARVFTYLAVALSIVLAVLFAVPTLRSEVVTTTATTVTTTTTVVPAPYVNPSYIKPPPAEVVACAVNLAEICTLCLNCPCNVTANVNVNAYAFESSSYVTGLLTSLNGAWNGECWSPSVYASQGPFNLSISQCQLPSSYDHVGIPLYYYPAGSWVWVQSIDVYGFNQYCTMVAMGPQVLNVTVVRNSGVSGYEIIVYVGSPSTSDTVSLSIYYNGILVYQVYKYIQLPSQWVSPCGVMSVDFGPIQPLACGTYTITATASAPGYPQSQYTTTLNPCVTTTTIVPSTTTTTIPVTTTTTITSTTTATVTATITITVTIPVTTTSTVTATSTVTSPVTSLVTTTVTLPVISTTTTTVTSTMTVTTTTPVPVTTTSTVIPGIVQAEATTLTVTVAILAAALVATVIRRR